MNSLVDSIATPTATPSEFPFPTWVYPPPLQEYIESFAKAGPFPLAFVGGSILPVAATAIGERRNLLVSSETDWVEPPVIWFIACGDSGCGKSPVMDEILKPLVNLDMDAHQMFEVERDAWRGKKENEKKGEVAPFNRAWIRTDATLEALGTDLSRKKDILCYYDEFAQWIGQMSGYNPKQGDTNRAKWLHLFTGKRLDRRRIGQGEEIDIVIPNPRVCILGGIQPSLLHKLSGSDDDGMTYRFLYAYGEKLLRSTRTGKTNGYAWWNSCVRWLVHLQIAMPSLSPEAFALIEEFDDSLVSEGVPPEVAAKMKTYAARLSLVLAHLWMYHEGTPLREVGEEDTIRALALCRFFVDQRDRVEDKLVPLNDGRITYSTVDNVLAYIKRLARKHGTTRLSQRDILRGKPAGIVRVEQLKQVLSVLQDQGHIAWEKVGREQIVEVLDR